MAYHTNRRGRLNRLDADDLNGGYDKEDDSETERCSGRPSDNQWDDSEALSKDVESDRSTEQIMCLLSWYFDTYQDQVPQGPSLLRQEPRPTKCKEFVEDSRRFVVLGERLVDTGRGPFSVS